MFLISDFMVKDYEHTLKLLQNVMMLLELECLINVKKVFQILEIVNMIDAETGETLLVDTTSNKVRMDYEKYYRENVNYFKDIFSKCGAGTISSRVDESYVTNY